MNELVERMARAIFEHRQFQANSPVHRPIQWVDGGNSEKQDEARDYARAALSAAHESLKSPEMIRAMVEAHKAACGFGHAAGIGAAIDAAFLGVKVERAMIQAGEIK